MLIWIYSRFVPLSVSSPPNNQICSRFDPYSKSSPILQRFWIIFLTDLSIFSNIFVPSPFFQQIWTNFPANLLDLIHPDFISNIHHPCPSLDSLTFIVNLIKIQIHQSSLMLLTIFSRYSSSPTIINVHRLRSTSDIVEFLLRLQHQVSSFGEVKDHHERWGSTILCTTTRWMVRWKTITR